ncbi:MAG: YbhN family protein [Methanotrichaceae archaeon]
MSSELELPTLRPGKSIALIALGMGVYFIYLYHLGFQEIIRALGNVNIAIFSLGFVLALAGVLGDSLAWQEIAKKFDYNVSIWDFFLIYMSCIFMNNLIPSGSFSGETTRIYFLDKIAGNSRIDKSSATVAATRIITAIPFIVGTLIGLVYLALATDAPAWTLATCSGITIILFCLNLGFFGVCYAEGWLERIIFPIVDHIERIFRIHIDRGMASGVMNQFHESMNMLASHKRTLFISTFWAVVGWLCMTLVAAITFRSMGVSIPLRAVFAVYTVMIFLQMLPIFLPGGIGLVDIVMITLFTAIGVPTHSAVVASILIRLIQLWFLTALGGIATAYLVKKINRDPQDPPSRSVQQKAFKCLR